MPAATMQWLKAVFIVHLVLLQLCMARKHHLEVQVTTKANVELSDLIKNMKINRSTSLCKDSLNCE